MLGARHIARDRQQLLGHPVQAVDRRHDHVPPPRASFHRRGEALESPGAATASCLDGFDRLGMPLPRPKVRPTPSFDGAKIFDLHHAHATFGHEFKASVEVEHLDAVGGTRQDASVELLALAQLRLGRPKARDDLLLIAPELVSSLGFTPQADDFGHLLHPVYDQGDLAVRAEHRRVYRAPPPFLETAVGVAHGVALHRHAIGRPGGDDASERGAQVPHAVGIRVGGIIGKKVEQPQSDLAGSCRPRDAEPGIVRRDDGPVRGCNDEERRRRRLEQRSVIVCVQRVLSGPGDWETRGSPKVIHAYASSAYLKEPSQSSS